MFIISLNYLAPADVVEQHLEAHIAFLDKYYEQQKFICSGRKNPRTGGYILAHNCTQDELQKLVKEDPFHQHGLASYEITEFIPTKYGVGFEVFATV